MVIGRKVLYNSPIQLQEELIMLFRKRTTRSCKTCLFSASLSAQQLLCAKRGIVADSFSCRRYRYDPCKRIPPKVKAPEFDKYKDEDFTL